jgi:SAM-dependent methyltransferase
MGQDESTARRTLAKIGRRVRRTARTARYGNPDPAGAAARRVVGLVEEFTDTDVRGWVSVPPDAPPVRVQLRIADFDAAITYATSPNTADDPTDDAAALPAQPTGALHQVAPPYERNSWQEIRPFAFHLRDLWDYAGPTTKLSVRAGDALLPIHGHGMYLLPARRRKHPLATLRAKLAEGYVFSQYGELQLSKKLDTVWQQRAMDLYDSVRRIVADEYGHDVFLTYGTLLGAVREGGYIAHDIDVDTAYIADGTDPRAAADELQRIAFTLMDRGLDAQTMYTAIHVRDRDDPDVRLDLFHLYFDDQGRLRFPFGIAGRSRFTRRDWRGTQEIDFLGRPALVPVDAERFVEHIYGPTWRQPKPGFDWSRERTTRASDADILPPQRWQSHWTNFYHRCRPAGPSPFALTVAARPDAPHTVVDLGCGNGRDSVYFAAGGRRVVGIDFNDLAIRQAIEAAADLAIDARPRFSVVDVTDADRMTELFAGLRDEADGEPVLFYLRFLFQALRPDAQDAVMAVIDAAARPGDQLAAEFRTTKDRDRPKHHDRPQYRRFQNGPAFGRRLVEEYRFTVLDEVEGTGLAPHFEEDPAVYRVVARRD